MIESALHRRLVRLDEVPRCGAPARRPPGAPPTESMRETLFVQLARRVPGLEPPLRQVVVRDDDGGFVGRVDLAWPARCLFVELDGEHHLHQPRHDAARQTAIVAATGWLVLPFTWTEVVNHPAACAHRLAAVLAHTA